MTFESFCSFIAANTHVPLDEITQNASFRDDLGVDSLQMVNLIVGLTDRMSVSMHAISGSHDLDTVGHLYQALIKEVSF
jgi:acyl carrier protein